ncbi:hypothetical protein [Streptomyces sp. NPDC059894]|uniref:hypothetical protein n=1 Tax=unclassified Streptomyces TaxID=2593676 RepID=UPI003666F760
MSIPPATDWAALHHAHGRASDIPGHLAALADADPVARRAAVSALTGSVYHQGTRWPASAHAVAPLVALVDTPTTPDRAVVLQVLHAVAIGDRGDEELPFDPERAFAEADRIGPSDEQAVLHVLFEQEEPDIEAVADVADAVAVRWAAAAYRAAEHHVGAFLRWLRDPDPAVAAHAAALLVRFPRVPGLASSLADVPCGAHEARASAHLALAYLPGPLGSPELTALTDALTSADEAVRVTAAVALARRRGTALPDEALTVLAHVHERDIAASVPGWDRSLRGQVALAVYRLGLAHTPAAPSGRAAG